MSDAIAGANLGIYIVFTIVGVIFYLYKQGQEEKFKNIEERFLEFKKESKHEDDEVRKEIRRVDEIRVEQITKLHMRVGDTEAGTCNVSDRISRLEGIDEQRTKEKAG